MTQFAISVRDLSKTFVGSRQALDHVSLDVRAGEMVGLIGASGSGKSTLLRQIAGLAGGDRGDNSMVCVHGATIQRSGRVANDIRQLRSGIGFVFQQFNLVGRLPVMTNVMTGQLHSMPLWRSLLRRFSPAQRALALHALHRVGIGDWALQRASTLSGGQLQRAAIARSLVQGAKVLLADEPIASLDPESARTVMDILTQINREDGCTVLVSLHQIDIAMKYCPRIIALKQGRVVFDGPSVSLTPAYLRQLYGGQADELLNVQPVSAATDPRALHSPVFNPVYSSVA